MARAGKVAANKAGVAKIDDNVDDINAVATGRKALTPEGRENQLIALSFDLVEQRLRNGTATAQETVHFLKLGSTRAKLEKKILETQAELYKAKADAYESAQRSEELYAKAIAAMRRYNGQGDDEDDEDIF